MSWSTEQSKLAHIVQHALAWDRPRYELVLRNVALVKPDKAGRISAKNISATNDGFERYMAFAEICGFIDRVHGAGYWSQKAREQCPRVRRKIEALWAQGVTYGFFAADGLAGFLERMTARRDLGPTRALADLDPTDAAKVLEAVKAIFARKLNERRSDVAM